MTTTTPVKTAQACTICGCWTRVGSHLKSGRFDESSVQVTEAEIDRARDRNPYRSQSREATRYAIAIGKHIGTHS